MKQPDQMARPAPTCGTSDVTVADPAASRNTCPWDCLQLGLHRQLVDRGGTARATWCEVCDESFTVTAWSRIPTPRRS